MFGGITPAIVDGAGRLPPLRPLLRRLHWRKFCAASGPVRLFHGIYADFAAAERDIPPDGHVGYDNEPSAKRLAEERFRIIPLDYPVLFWLQRLLPECRLLFDFGGNVGISYFGFRKYLQYPATLTWLVDEVPAVAAAGARIASQEHVPQLRFTTTLEELPQADVFMAAGSLHFVEKPFAMLGSAPRLPRHLLLNKVPVIELPAAVTLHNMGSAFCPYNLFNREEFLQGFHHLGYEVIDEWTTPGLGVRIPLYREHSLRAYSGFYFRKVSPLR